MQPKFLTIALALAVGIAAPALAQPNAEAGKALYDLQCKACHMAPISPKLEGVYNRKIASRADYTMGYSPAMKAKASQTWNEANLSAYLTNPQTWTPGGKMTMAVPDAANRANIIAYLKTLK